METKQELDFVIDENLEEVEFIPIKKINMTFDKSSKTENNMYFENMETIIQNILLRPENDVLTYDILDTEKSKRNKLLSLKEKQRQMKVGEIWQEIIGNYDEFITPTEKKNETKCSYDLYIL